LSVDALQEMLTAEELAAVAVTFAGVKGAVVSGAGPPPPPPPPPPLEPPPPEPGGTVIEAPLPAVSVSTLPQATSSPAATSDISALAPARRKSLGVARKDADIRLPT
jgi:hypothetical protein